MSCGAVARHTACHDAGTFSSSSAVAADDAAAGAGAAAADDARLDMYIGGRAMGRIICAAEAPSCALAASRTMREKARASEYGAPTMLCASDTTPAASTSVRSGTRATTGL